MSQTVIKNFKRGDTFSYGCLVQLPAGTWDAEGQIMLNDSTRDDFDVTLTAPVAPETRHTLLIERAAAATAAWPVGKRRADILFFDNSSPAVKRRTSTFLVDVIEGITE